MIVSGPCVHEIVEAVHAAQAAEGDERYGLLITGLKAHGRRGRDVKAHTVGGFAVEFEGAVHFEKVEMRTDLDGAIAGIAHLDAEGGAGLVERDWRVGKNDAADGDILHIIHGFLPVFVRGRGGLRQ